MPICCIETNVSQEKFDDAFLKAMTSNLAQLIGKPESFIMLTVEGDKRMSFGGTTDPCALVNLTSIGCINEEKNAMYSASIFKALNEKGVDSNRTYICFHNAERDHTAWNNKLFSQ